MYVIHFLIKSKNISTESSYENFGIWEKLRASSPEKIYNSFKEYLVESDFGHPLSKTDTLGYVCPKILRGIDCIVDSLRELV